MYSKILALAAMVASASAFAPTSFGVPTSTRLYFDYGKYDDKLWDMTAKDDVYNSWDPNSPRSTTNFNPYETFKGNSPDASGIYPGESFYKDPARPDMNFAVMQAESCSRCKSC